MAINASCSCGKTFRVPDEYAGKRTRCLSCGEIVRIPELPEQGGLTSLLDDLTPDEMNQGEPLAALPPRRHRRPSGPSAPVIVAITGAFMTLLFVIVLVIILGRPDSAKQSADSDGEQSADSDSTAREVPGTVPPTVLAPPGETPPTPGPGKPPAVETMPVLVSTNVHAATIVVRDADTQEEVGRIQLLGRDRSHQFELDASRKYECEASVGNESVMQLVEQSDEVQLDFDPMTVEDLCRMAVCLIRLPEGGFGSGFLFGDRQTIVTAAHVLATRAVKDVDIVFSPAEADETKYNGA